jgi:DNA-binding transcriptional MocR family regulator
MKIEIDRESPIPLYLQIARQIRDQISAGKLPEGFQLPPERRLAQELDINRCTVLSAYRELKRKGLVEARVGSGTTVLPLAESPPGVEEAHGMPWRQLFRETSARASDPLLRDLLELTERADVIPMAIGLPAPELLPVDLYRELTAELSHEIGPASLLHSPTEGVSVLRGSLAQWMQERSFACRASEILVLSGSQQGLDIATRVFLDPGDPVVVEDPSYIGALQIFRAARAKLIGIPTDKDGMRTDILASILRHQRPKLIYTLPTYQNPSGVVMSLERRHQLLELAQRHQVPILEDDPYSDLGYEGDSVPPLKSLDRHGQVLYLSTISKALFPGLRIGWLVGPRAVVRQFALVKQAVDLHSNTPGQYLLDLFLRRGHYKEHRQRIRRAYESRRDVMDEALRQHAPPGVTWQKPRGGFYIWCRLPEGTERSRLLAQASEAGVSFLPGWFCFAADPDSTHLRLNFTHPPESQIKTGIARLMNAVQCSCDISRDRDLVEAGTPPIV